MKVIEFLKNIINQGTVLQKIFLVLFVLNLTVTLFYLSNRNVSGDHIKKIEYLTYDCYTSVPSTETIRRSDVLIGLPMIDSTHSPGPYSKDYLVEKIDREEEKKYRLFYNVNYYDYTNFGLTYQELFLWIFIGGFLYFCMYVFKEREV